MDELETIIAEANFPDTCDPEEWTNSFITYVIDHGCYKGEYSEIDPKVIRLWFTAALLTGFSRMFDKPNFDQSIHDYIDKEYLKK